MPHNTPYIAPSNRRVVWDGQSHNWVPDGRAVPDQTMSRFPGVPWANIAVSGHGWVLLLDQFPVSRITNQARSNGVDIWIGNGMQGDVINDADDGGQHTGEQCYDIAKDYTSLVRRSGFDVLIGIVPPAIGPNVFGLGRPNAFETQALEDIRTLTREDPDGIYDVVVDCSVPPFDDATNLYWFDIDRTHFRPPGAKAMADLITPVLATYLT